MTPGEAVDSSDKTSEIKEEEPTNWPPSAYLSGLKNEMDTALRPLLGLTEPTICAYASRRIHEKRGKVPASNIPATLSADQVLRESADFTTAQLRFSPSTKQIKLPVLWQYDLLHLVEQLPEHRRRAHHDSLHSFFRRSTARATLLEHLDYIREQDGWMKLLWHTYNPFFGDADYYTISGQTDSGQPLRWVDGAFSAISDGSISKAAQYLGLQQLVDSIEKQDPGSTSMHQLFHQKLDRIADFAHALAARNSGAMFRPYHEHHPGDYWWWACKNLAAAEIDGRALYRRLWLATRSYLEAKGVHNLLYVYAPDVPDSFEEIDSREKFLAHYRCGMPDLAKIDVLSMTGYLHKFATAADQQKEKEILEQFIGDPDRIHQKFNIVKSLRFERLLQVAGWLREAYPGKYVGVSETGQDYRSYQLPLEHNPACQSFWSDYALAKLSAQPMERLPHFICFWRNDEHDGKSQAAHPFASDSEVFNRECTAIGEAFTCRLSNLEPPLA